MLSSVGGNLAATEVGSLVNGNNSNMMPTSNPVLQGPPTSLQGGSLGNVGSSGGNYPAGGLQTDPGYGYSTGANTGSMDWSSLFGSLGGLAGTALGGVAAGNQGNMLNNAYTTAGNAANSGNTFGFNGLGGMGGQFANGQLNMQPGQFANPFNQFSTFAGNQGSMANMYGNGGVPSNVTSGFNQFNTQIGMGINNANAGATSAMGVMGMGQNMLGSANANQASAYQTALQAGQQALNPQIQQQSNALLNSNFSKGMSGTSGGALQTQALQNSFNTAELQNQSNAVGQGLNAFNSTINAGTGMFNSGAGMLGNFNTQGVNFGQAGMSGAMNYNAFSPQLAGMYQTNANSGVTGSAGINNMMLGNFQAGLGSITNQGNQMNAGARNQVIAGMGYNGGLAGYANGVLTNPGSMSNLTSGAGSLLNGLTGGAFSNFFSGGGGNSLNDESNYSTALNPQSPANNYWPGYTAPNEGIPSYLSQTAPAFDPTNFDNTSLWGP
jgi:hypothetical protein